MNPIFVAIDTPDLNRAHELAAASRGAACGIKLGLEFFCASGPAAVQALASSGLPLFLDLKLHDIPNTVAKAVSALAPLRPSILTVHAAGGAAMIAAAKAAAPSDTRIVAVTVLTSLDDEDLADAGVGGSPAEQVRRLAGLARSAGADGIVCSGAEVAVARSDWPEGLLVVPGVRPQGSASADQKRIVTPRQALADGASILVIGRPITAAADPRRAAEDIAAELGSADNLMRVQ